MPNVMNQSSYIGWKVLLCQTDRLRNVVLLTVQRCDNSKVFPLDNQHNSYVAFPQGRVRLEKVNPKNAHPALSHGYPSTAVRSQQVRS
ncbi:unnamed protein product [Schistosoma mattheei]|uniref:Uncharacterized protein n=1 Tax=Schistosoma mattheei TaxID=31246 RepID=A0A183P0X0_9TREM|nr:unnamed protein product [Schistosoma mattheei]